MSPKFDEYSNYTKKNNKTKTLVCSFTHGRRSDKTA